MQMKCKYHANKLLPGGAGLRAEGAGRGLLSRDPFLGGGSLSPDRPNPPPPRGVDYPAWPFQKGNSGTLFPPTAPSQTPFPNPTALGDSGVL